MVLRGGGWFLEWCWPKIGDERPPHTDKVNERFLVGSGRVNKVPGQHSAWWLTSRVIAPSGSPRAPIPHSLSQSQTHTSTHTSHTDDHHFASNSYQGENISQMSECRTMISYICDQQTFRRLNLLAHRRRNHRKFQTFDLFASWMPKCLHRCVVSVMHARESRDMSSEWQFNFVTHRAICRMRWKFLGILSRLEFAGPHKWTLEDAFWIKSMVLISKMWSKIHKKKKLKTCENSTA
jgi:hypothetical protein